MSFTSSSLTVPISPAAHEIARQFALEQADVPTGKRVYLNTLAVWVVQRYLAWLQIDTDVDASQSWQPQFQALFDVADLVLPNLGRLECRPVLPGEEEIGLPLGRVGDRIGYVAIRFNDALQEAELLGFVAATEVDEDAEKLPLHVLQPLDSLLDRLADLEARAETVDHSAATTTLVHLSRWLQHSFETGWQAVEDLFGASTPALAFRRSATRRAKRFSLEQAGTQPASLALVVSLTGDRPDQVCIHLYLCPVEPTVHLPSQLQLRVLNDAGEVFRQITAGAADTFVQYEFTAQVGEHFSVEVISGTAQMIQSFSL